MAATNPRYDIFPYNERREAERTATVFRPVLIETDAFAGFCLVRNLSPHGLMGEIYTSFADEQLVTIYFGHSREIHGMLKWCKDGRVGIEFDAQISVSDVLAEMATRSVDGLINRAPRLQIRCPAELVIEQQGRTVEVEDISQRGVRVGASFMQVNHEVDIQIDGLDRRKAIVRWAQAGTAGLNFLRPLSFEQLAQWAVQRQASTLRIDDHNRTARVDFDRGWTVRIAS